MEIKIPKLQHHKATGRARVLYDGKHIYFGAWGDPETEKRYRRWAAELIASDGVNSPDNVLVSEIAMQYTAHCEHYYGEASSETDNVKRALAPLVELYGSIPAAEFTPKRLKAVRALWLQRDKPLSRGTVNKLTRLIRRAFKWAASEGLIDYTVYAALTTVEGLRKGRVKGAKEPRPIEPVPENDLQAVLKIAPPILRDMIVLQSLTGMRPGEVCNLKRRDIDTSGDVWTVAIHDHKMAHMEGSRPRFVAIGPRGQKVLKRYLLRPESTYLFNPREALKDKAAQAETHRRPRQKPTPRKTERTVAQHYTVSAYRRAITRLCEEADIAPWTPNQLRKYAATRVREKYGLDAAQALLGHSSANTSEIYAKVNETKVVQIAKELG